MGLKKLKPKFSAQYPPVTGYCSPSSTIPSFHHSGSHPVHPVILSKNFSGGFTLLEVMVSMALIATALLAILRLQTQGLDLQSEARFMTTARLLTQERLAWISGNADEFREGRSEGDFGEDYPEFHYTQEIMRTGSTGNLYHVSLALFEDGGERTERSFLVETFMYRKP